MSTATLLRAVKRGLVHEARAHKQAAIEAQAQSQLCYLTTPRFWSVEAVYPPREPEAALLRPANPFANPFWSVERPLPHAWIGEDTGYYPLMLNAPRVAFKPIPAHRRAELI